MKRLGRFIHTQCHTLTNTVQNNLILRAVIYNDRAIPNGDNILNMLLTLMKYSYLLRSNTRRNLKKTHCHTLQL